MAIVTILLLVARPRGASAQGRAILVPHASRLFVLAPISTSAPAGDQHAAGGLIGAGAVGIIGAVIGYGLCHDSDTQHGSCVGSAVGVGLLGAVVGWVTGSLIGGLIPKGP